MIVHKYDGHISVIIEIVATNLVTVDVIIHLHQTIIRHHDWGPLVKVQASILKTRGW